MIREGDDVDEMVVVEIKIACVVRRTNDVNVVFNFKLPTSKSD